MNFCRMNKSKALKFALGAIQEFFCANDSDLGAQETTIKKIKITLKLILMISSQIRVSI